MSLHILMTNLVLANNTGTELYVRDVAMALIRRGHRVAVYSTVLGEIAEQLRKATIPVVDRLENLAFVPNIIHGHQTIETLTALLHFTDAPGLFACHSWESAFDQPPHFPRLYRYAAVSDAVRDRLVCEGAIPADRVELLHNFVDLKKFTPRGPLPVRPARALIFSNYATEASVRLMTEACAARGVSVEVAGAGVGRAIDRPERLLANVDLVFGLGRSAIEALAVGCAVVVADVIGLGEMVLPGNVQAMRDINFGLRAVGGPLEVHGLLAQIDRYDASAAAEASRWIRTVAGLDMAIDRLLNVYAKVIAEHRAVADRLDRLAELRAMAQYLASADGRVRVLERGQVFAELRPWLEELRQFKTGEKPHGRPPAARSAGDYIEGVRLAWKKSAVEFVADLYRLILVREPDAEGLRVNTARLKTGEARLDLVRMIASSEEALRLGVPAGWLKTLAEEKFTQG